MLNRFRNKATGAFIQTFASGHGLTDPNGLVFGSDGNLYVASSHANDVQRFNVTTGAFVDTFISAGSGGLDQPSDMIFGPDGNLYVSGFGNNAVLVYDGTTGSSMGTFLSGGGLSEPNQILLTPGSTVPEPASLTMLGLGLAGLLGHGWSRKVKASSRRN